VPRSYVEQAGDPYKEEMEECVALIMAELGARGVCNHHTLAYQSRVGPVEWLKPYTDETIEALGAGGCTALLAVPISFVSEHIETLEEIDMEYRELALASGIRDWGRVPALDTNETFIGDLADAVVEALPFVGAMIGNTDALVPVGNVESLLAVYDGERRQLPAPESLGWRPGWTLSSEAWNGRIAMISLIIIALLEALTGRSVFGDLFFSSVRPWV
jgi:protoporphyrin/coproporphyrin ferrochelatase